MRLKYLFAGAVGTLIAFGAPASVAYAANLVTNGDFSAGNTGFTSDYTYNPANYGNNGDYFVQSDYNGFKDHTTGTGNFLVGDGATDVGSRVWAETVSTVAGADYTFSYYHSEFNGGPNASLAFILDGVKVGPSVAPSDRTWNQFSYTFNSGGASSHNLAIVDETLGYAYNDFGLDDIALDGPAPGGVPEPSTWALMLVGFGGIGLSMRHRPKAGGVIA